MKQSIPEVPQGLAPALNIFLRWVRDQLKRLGGQEAESRLAKMEARLDALEQKQGGAEG